MDKISLTILNWETYQPRKELKSLSWFRIDTGLFNGRTYYKLKNDGIILFLFLLALAAEKNKCDVSIELDFIADKIKLEKASILSYIKILEEIQLVHVSVQICANSCPTIHNKQTIQTDTTNKHISTEPQKAVALVNTQDKSVIVLTASKQFLIKKELLQSWADTYPKEFLELSLKEMKNWILANDHKAPKSAWGKFMNGWFQRGWERHRKTMASNAPSKITSDDLAKFLNGEI